MSASARWSLQRRIRLQLLALLAAFWLLASAMVVWGLWTETGRVLDAALGETAEHLLMLPDASLARHGAAHQLTAGVLPAEPVVYQLQRGDGQVLMRSHEAPDTALQPGAGSGLSWHRGWRVLTLVDATQGRRIQVAEPAGRRAALLWANAGWLLGALLALLAAAALVLDRLLRRSFGSLEPARRALAERAEHDLRPVASPLAPAELQPWLDTVNALLDRVGRLVEAERRFAARTAHELRTPLAAAQAQAQRLVQLSGDETHRAAAQALLRQLERLTHLATRLLQLARIESGVALQRGRIDLVGLALLVADDYAAAQRSGRLHIEVLRQPQPVQGDVDALGIALRNLIDNALRHAGDEAAVRVWIDGTVLRVDDDGPGLSPDQLAALRARCAQDGGILATGPGLGLPIVATIARQSGAGFSLASPRPDAPPGVAGFSAALDFGGPA